MLRLAYAVVIEKAAGNYCAYVPDLPGCVATGRTREEAHQQICEAIVFHLEGLKEDGLPIPEPESSAAVVGVYRSNPSSAVSFQNLQKMVGSNSLAMA